MSVSPVADEAVRNAWRGVIDPELGDNVVDLGMVHGIDVDRHSGEADMTIALTTSGCPMRAQLMKDVKLRVASLPDVAEVRVHFWEMTVEQKRSHMAQARWKARDNALDTDIPTAARIVALASGKNGVGKSSVTANLALLLAQRRLTVGVLDADIGGYSIPRMLGMEGRVQGDKDESGRGPVRPAGEAHGAGPAQGSVDGLDRGRPRGPSRHVAAEPGRTALPRRRALGEHERVRGRGRHSVCLFGSGGGERLAEQIGVPLLGSILLDPAVGVGGDAGEPATVAAPHSPAAQAFAALAECIVTEAIPLVEMATCTAQLLFKAAGLVPDSTESSNPRGPTLP